MKTAYSFSLQSKLRYLASVGHTSAPWLVARNDLDVCDLCAIAGPKTRRLMIDVEKRMALTGLINVYAVACRSCPATTGEDGQGESSVL